MANIMVRVGGKSITMTLDRVPVAGEQIDLGDKGTVRVVGVTHSGRVGLDAIVDAEKPRAK